MTPSAKHEPACTAPRDPSAVLQRAAELAPTKLLKKPLPEKLHASGRLVTQEVATGVPHAVVVVATINEVGVDKPCAQTATLFCKHWRKSFPLKRLLAKQVAADVVP